jgi:hypothetical protein
MKLNTTSNKEKEEGKEKGDVVLVRAINTYRGNRGISPLILNLVARWR